jgi:hypothetical protein
VKRCRVYVASLAGAASPFVCAGASTVEVEGRGDLGGPSALARERRLAFFSFTALSASKFFHLRQPSKSMRACMQPHSLTLRSSHTKLTGYVRVSIFPGLERELS